ncbi:MAG: biopolymer transporter ExbD [Deltaproteobacteria bacterium]|jgi:biopolymer transport protein TolR|nr:biopolymer transporter ExbD [Deltaproteobacteria bacterium]
MERNPELIHGGGDVRSISDINVTPFIDVMLVLLIIFMVTAPLMMGGVRINLPKTATTPMPRPDHPLIVSLDAESQVFVDKDPVNDGLRAETFRRLALESESGEVFVRGDGEVKYARMMELMSELGQAGFARVTLVTNAQTVQDPGKEAEAPRPQDATGQGHAEPAPPAAKVAEKGTETEAPAVPAMAF